MVTFWRRLPRFDYVKAGSLDDVLKLLADGEGRTCKVYAGGTDLIPKLRERVIGVPDLLIDLKGVPDLDYIECGEGGVLRIGALATVSSVAHSALVKERFGVLAQAATSIASTQVQNRGTIVGNICNAVPSADSAPALLCLGAEVVCLSRRGERTVGIEGFFKGPNQTDLAPDEVVKEIRIPEMAGGAKGVYLKLSPRSKMDLAVVGVAAVAVMEEGKYKDVRLALGAVAPTPLRARRAEAVLLGKGAAEKAVEKAARTASEEARPIDDHRASAQYRKMMVSVLVKRAVQGLYPN